MNKTHVILLFMGCFYIGMQIGAPLGTMLAMSCNKPEVEVYEPVKNRMDIATTLEREMGVKFLSYDVDFDGLVTASWEYSDHRIGGTDWTDSENIGMLVNEQRDWKVCLDSECFWVVYPDRESKYHGKCWRHFPIPDATEEFDLRIPGNKPVIIIETEEEAKQELILIDAEDILRKL